MILLAQSARLKGPSVDALDGKASLLGKPLTNHWKEPEPRANQMEAAADPNAESRVNSWHFTAGSLRWPLIIAHRGDASSAPENTIPAFQNALAGGADGIELDVRLTRDGKLVVFHDRKLGRTCDGDGLVNHCDLAELRSKDAGSWFSPEFRAELTPTLDEVFEAMPRDFLINVEMKVVLKDMKPIAHRVAETIQRHQRWDATLVASFNAVCLYYLRKLDPRITRGYIWPKRHPFPTMFRVLNPLAQAQWYDPAQGSYSTKLHRELYQQGSRMLAWDVDFGRDLVRMAGAHLDAVVTDNLADLVQQKRDLE